MPELAILLVRWASVGAAWVARNVRLLTMTWLGLAAGTLPAWASFTPFAAVCLASPGSFATALDVVGYATAPASVTVNGQPAYEKGEYFRKEVTVANGSAPQNVAIDVVATQGGTATDSGRLLVPNAHRFRLEFGYDWLGRRLSKTVKTWNGSAFAHPVTTRFVYDEWRLLAELDAANTVLRSYTWGPDLSGTLDDAGGIGGLLFVTQHPGLATHFACYDGSGNVVALVAADGTGVTARYEYGPFGEAIGVRGAYAETNPIRWSTKYTDAETELVYYGYRYYSPSLGRWINKDPSEEEGGNNLFAFVLNSPVFWYDPTGEAPKRPKTWFAVVDVIAQLSRVLHGDPMSAAGSPAVQGAEWARRVTAAQEAAIRVAVTSGGAGPDPKQSLYVHRGGWGSKGLAAAAVLGGLSHVAYAASGHADQHAASFASNATDYYAHRLQGDAASADLDAAMMLVDMLNMTGSTYIATMFWGLLPE